MKWCALLHVEDALIYLKEEALLQFLEFKKCVKINWYTLLSTLRKEKKKSCLRHYFHLRCKWQALLNISCSCGIDGCSMCANRRLQGHQSFQKTFSSHGKETCSGIKCSPSFQAFHMDTSLFVNMFPFFAPWAEQFSCTHARAMSWCVWIRDTSPQASCLQPPKLKKCLKAARASCFTSWSYLWQEEWIR